jgi:hypothetical protein
MRRTSMVKLGSVAAAVAAATMWMAPAWGQTGPAWSQTGPAWSQAGPAAGQAGAVSSMTAAATRPAASPSLTQELAEARLATAKYATNLARAKADGYEVITPMMPNMGIHFLNPHVAGFNIGKPAILVYEHHGSQWQLGALEWVFTSMPKTPPLPNATFGFFPAACHYKDGTFITDENSKTCKKTNPKTGSAFNFWHPDLTTMHVWIWYPNPAGLYSSTNPLVAPFNGG